MRICAAIATAFLLDLIFGDPVKIPHIVVLMGKSISAAEKKLRGIFPKSASGELAAGMLLAASVPIFWGAAIFLTARVLGALHCGAAFAFEVFICWQCLAARSLERAAGKVKSALKNGMDEARAALSMIVGRDTKELNAPAVIRATVETAAENCCDGVIAPLFFMALGGAPLAVAYKAVNTLDSMVGYKNERYLYFGRASARLDDAANFIPARLSAVLLIVSAYILGFDGRGAAKVFLRDRKNHASPNSGQGEAACAGALGIRLGGGAHYFGQWVEKPYIGDAKREACPNDITLACRMMLTASALGAAAAVLIRGAVVCGLI